MNNINFEWDEKKNKSNFIKHKIKFEDAKAVFFDENAKLISDPDHSNDEERFILLGMNKVLRLLVT